MCLDHVLDILHPRSEIRIEHETQKTVHRNMTTLNYAPFFCSFRDYVERCEYGGIDSGRKLTIRSNRLHCDHFVQQMVLIMLFDEFLRNPQKVLFQYGHGHDFNHIQRITRASDEHAHKVINVLRVEPEKTSTEEIRSILHQVSAIQDSIILVIPNDEGSDQFTDILHEFRINQLVDLPQNRVHDPKDRAELIHRSSALAFQQWALSHQGDKKFQLSQDAMERTELLVNPIDWAILHEAERIAEDLSDPYEILEEFFSALNSMSQTQSQTIISAIANGSPVPYKHLLRVGAQTFKKSELGHDMAYWVECCLDKWLNVSWAFPCGLSPVNKNGGPAAIVPDAPVDSALDQWEDSCYEILTCLLKERRKNGRSEKTPPSKIMDMDRVDRFVNTLGENFLEIDASKVSWDAIELLRWPHLRYPMPSAITRRMRQAGRYLWIRQQGLDLAAVLPLGRRRYRMLLDTVEQYWTVLEWARNISNSLPSGWRQCVTYLTTIISNHSVEDAWRREWSQIYDALLCLVRNGSPVLVICDRTMRGKPVSGDKLGTREVLAKAQGYGQLIGRLRETRHLRMGEFLIPLWGRHRGAQALERLHREWRLLEILRENVGEEGPDRIQAMTGFFKDLFQAVGGASNDDEFASRLMAWMKDMDLHGRKDHKAWYIKELIGEPPEWYPDHKLHSKLGGKLDYGWKALDAAVDLEALTRRHRYMDGYHLLACINDLRIGIKDATKTRFPLSTVEKILDLFVASLEGIMAQLSWCVEMAGHEDLAAKIQPPNIRIQPPADFSPPSKEAMKDVIRIVQDDYGWSIYQLGLPGRSNKLSYFSRGADFELE
ncbi:hypothetical protein SAMN02745216_02364 [Desulfatibacillum alkenivorans DSM 16219]|uniref:Uncharacterized protein n=1 Tax=Desulfatibacillum alkenivorans DSM 16219 TaxID=1121393 RepID=A0A1M6MHD1_9BACT|nr:hypothetical protein [Desulfatibacillum alkenivorans]SHJ82892.1 hypothetical protein SAMN02745216_02364 [Desulfatibacillum alkenivorans DSM 16219]